MENVTPGSEEYRGFLLDNVLHSPNEGDIHYNVYIPDAYDGTKELWDGCSIIKNQNKPKG